MGRDEEIRLIREILARPDRMGVVIGGEAGTGKTRLAREATQTAEADGYDVERIVASRAAASIPFGAFATLLPEFGSSASQLYRLRVAVEAVAARSATGRLVLVVDDAHLLGEASAALLHRIVVDRLAQVVATVRSGELVPEPVVAMWKDADAERLDLQGLSREETAALVRGGLDGEVDGTALHQIWVASKGNPLYVRELVLGAVAAATLRLEGGVWSLAGRLGMPPSLAELVDERLVDLSPDGTNALHTLAVADAIGLSALQALHPMSLAELEDRELIEITDEGRRRTVRLTHPLYGDVLRRRMPRTASMGIADDLADLVEGHGARRRDDSLRVATWRLDAGSPTETTLLVDAAEEAYRRGDFDLAERILHNALRGADDAGPRLLLGQILHESGRHDAAEEVYEALAVTTLPAPVRVRAAVQRSVNLFFGLGLPDAAFARLAEEQASLDDTRSAAEIAANRAWLHVVTGEPDKARSLVRPLLGHDETDIALVAAVTSAWVDAATGRCAEGLTAAVEADALTAGPTRLNRFRDFPELPHALALVEDGRLDDADELIARSYAASLDGHPAFVQGWWVLLAGILGLRQGRVRSAAGWFRQGVLLQQRLHQHGYVRWHLAGLALAQAQAGDLDAATAALDEHDRVEPGPVRLFAGYAARARAWIATLSGDRADAQSTLVDEAEAATAMGLHSSASLALHDLVRIGEASRAVEPLRDLARRTTSSAVERRADHARAAADRDPDGLVAVADAWEETSAHLLAAEALAEAAALLVTADERRRARGLQRRAAALAARCEGAVTPGLRRIAEVIPLTQREREVALLAASGMASREIAERLHVSRRTVDNLLQRAYTKLGVHSRAEIVAALDVHDPAPSPLTPA